jgi:LacI family transcriptional regulator
VLNNHIYVKEEVRQRVLKAAKELGYLTPDANNQNTEPRPMNKQLREIGFVYYSKVDPYGAPVNTFWSSMLHGAEREANKSNIKITYRSIGELAASPTSLLAAINEMKLGGILLVGPAEAEVVRSLRETQLPLVLVDNYLPKTSVDAVVSDNFEGARQAVEYLLQMGHTRIAFIGGPTVMAARPVNQVFTIERRAAGYRTALLDAGIAVDYNLYEAGNLSVDGGYLACKRLLDKKASFTALFCANDATAIGAVKALREAGLEVPEDVSVAGFDNIDMAEHYHPALTTININKEGMGAAAVKTLLARAADPEAASATIMLEVELIKRESVSAVKR